MISADDDAIYIYIPLDYDPSLEATTLPKAPPISHESWMVLDPNQWARHLFYKSTAGALPCYEPTFKFSESPLK